MRESSLGRFLFRRLKRLFISGKLIKRKTKVPSKPKTDNSNLKHKSPRCIDNNHNSCDLNVRQEQNITINNSLTSKTQSQPLNNLKHKRNMPISPPKTFKTASKTEYLLSDKTKTPMKVHRNRDKNKLRRNKKMEKISLHNKFAQETDSVKRRCELVAEESRRLIMKNNKKPEVFINENVHCTRGNFTENNKHIVINKRVRETIIHQYIPIPKKTNASKIQDLKSFKSNYDLLHTIISSQINESDFRKKNYTSEAGVDREQIETKYQNIKNTDLNIPTSTYKPDNGLLQKSLNNYVIQTPEQNFKTLLRKPGFQANMPEHIEILHEDKFRDLSSCNEITFDNIEKVTDNNFEFYDMNSISSPHKLKDHSEVRTESYNSHNFNKSLEDSPFPGITYQSHNYYDQDVPPVSNVELNYKKSRNFITTQSRENFLMKTNFNPKHKFKRNKTNLFSKLFQSHTKNSFNKLFNTDNNTKNSIRQSYTIEFTESNKHDFEYTPMNHKKRNTDTNYSIKKNTYKSFEAMTQSMGYIFNNFSFDTESPNNPNSYCSPECNNMINDLNYEPINGNAYTLTNSRIDHDIGMLNHGNWDNNETYTIERSRVSNNKSNITEGPELTNTENQAFNYEDFVFVSKPDDKNVDDDIVMNPIDVCETLLTDPVSVDKSKHFETSFERSICVRNVVVEEIGNCNTILNDSMNIDFPDYVIPVRIDPTQTKCQENNINEEISHHFTIPDSIMSEFNQSLRMTVKAAYEKTTNALDLNNDLNMVVENMKKNDETIAFNLKNRLLFVPKGKLTTK